MTRMGHRLSGSVAAIRPAVKVGAGLLLVLATLFAVIASAPAASSTSGRAAPTGPEPERANRSSDKAFGKLPVRFEANEGQTAPEVRFLARGSGYTVFLTPTEAVLTLARPGTADVVRLSLAGGNEHPELVGLDRLEGHSNYYGGSDPSQWHEGVATYGSVAYRNAYPGIDMVFHGEDGQVKFDFVVAPGANPSVISVQVDGAELTGDGGDLLLTTPSGAQVRKPAPVVYQEVDGARRAVAAAYVLKNDGRFGFHLGSYDPAHPLVIDPELAYSFTLQGEEPYRIAVDRFGHAYVHGETTSADFPGNSQPAGDSPDVFVAKLKTDGSGVMYATFLGRRRAPNTPDWYTQRLRVLSVDVGDDGRAYVAGESLDDEHPDTVPVVGGTQREPGLVPGPPNCPQRCALDDQQRYDGFLLRLEGDGRVSYGTYLQDHMRVQDVAVDSTGVYLVGNTQNPALRTTSNAVQATPQGPFGQDSQMGWGFVARVVPGPSTSFYRYLTYFGNGLHIQGVAAGGPDPNSAHITGTLNWYPTFPDQDTNGSAKTGAGDRAPEVPVKNALQGTRRQTQQDMFVAKINTDATPGAALVYSTYLGGDDTGCGGPSYTGIGYACQGALDIGIDDGGMMYVTGFSRSSTFPTTLVPPKTAGFQSANLGEADAFLSRIDPSKSGDASLVYSTYLGGEDDERAYGIAVASPQAVTVTGWTRSSTYPVKDPLAGQDKYRPGPTAIDGTDGFVTTIDVTQAGPPGLVRSTFLGGGKSDRGRSVAVDPAGDLYVRGLTESTDFPRSARAFASGGSGSFLTKVDVPCPVAGTTPTTPTLPGIPGAGASASAGIVGFGLIDGGLSLSAWITAAVQKCRRRRATRPTIGPPEPPRRGEGGLTLVELLVVVVILGILSAVVVFAVRGADDKGEQAAIQTDERIVRTALETYCAQKGRYPQPVPGKDAMQILVDEKFLGTRSDHHDRLETGNILPLPEGNCPGPGPNHYQLNGPPTTPPTSTGPTTTLPPPIPPCP